VVTILVDLVKYRIIEATSMVIFVIIYRFETYLSYVGVCKLMLFGATSELTTCG